MKKKNEEEKKAGKKAGTIVKKPGKNERGGGLIAFWIETTMAHSLYDIRIKCIRQEAEKLGSWCVAIGTFWEKLYDALPTSGMGNPQGVGGCGGSQAR